MCCNFISNCVSIYILLACSVLAQLDYWLGLLRCGTAAAISFGGRQRQTKLRLCGLFELSNLHFSFQKLLLANSTMKPLKRAQTYLEKLRRRRSDPLDEENQRQGTRKRGIDSQLAQSKPKQYEYALSGYYLSGRVLLAYLKEKFPGAQYPDFDFRMTVGTLQS
jgi:hypothetical protein